jgi:hypothetical protein
MFELRKAIQSFGRTKCFRFADILKIGFKTSASKGKIFEKFD